MRRAKIVCTLGPAVDGRVAEFVRAGMDVARLNLSHGSYDEHQKRYDEAELRVIDWAARARQLVVIELGAGTAIPSARRFGERTRQPLVRINVRESEVARQPVADECEAGVGVAHGVRGEEGRMGFARRGVERPL